MALSGSVNRTMIKDLFSRLDEDREALVRKLNTGEDLYPNCDNSIWLRSCTKETTSPIHGKPKGKIPKWLTGSLLRNGPGCMSVGEFEFKHLFDNSALLHRYAHHCIMMTLVSMVYRISVFSNRFAFDNGTVTYQCRFLKSNTYKQNHAAQRIVVTEFGTRACPDPCQTIFHRFANVFNWNFDETDNAMISIYPIGDEYYALTEFPVMIRIDPKTLETLDNVNIAKKMGIVHHTAHPLLASNGDVYNLATIPKIDGPYYGVVRFPRCDPETGQQHSGADGMFDKMHVVALVKCRWPLHPGYMHTFGMTEHYFVVVEQPLSVSIPTALVNRFNGEPLSSALKWFPDHPTLIHLISRVDGQTVTTYEAESFFYLHIINQYENNDSVVIDICCYRDPAMLDCLYIKELQNLNKNPDYAAMFRSRPLRFMLPLTGQKNGGRLAAQHPFVWPEALCDLGCETPRINECRAGIKYRFFYAISSDVDAKNPGTIIKVDTVNKKCITWCERNVYPSEPIFIASPNAEDEDDGVVMSSIVWGGTEHQRRTGVLVLDATTLKELGRVTFDTESPVPKCLHGCFRCSGTMVNFLNCLFKDNLCINNAFVLHIFIIYIYIDLFS
ncbi:carotenoid isomerooxygenase-like isoform X3 [Adelges cooleyi]|nr:carotenoid isomerooxygenase-like isoform X3 [Adelges cooleyi]